MRRFLALSVMTLSSLSIASLSDQLKGDWTLKELSCKGAKQKLENDYTLSFEGATGSYVSKNKTCTQVELETFEYPSANTVLIKSGLRDCEPNPCAADLPAKECGKETNPHKVPFKVKFANDGKTMTLTTSDSKSVDCVGAGQSKPAVFTFQKAVAH